MRMVIRGDEAICDEINDDLFASWDIYDILEAVGGPLGGIGDEVEDLLAPLAPHSPNQ